MQRGLFASFDTTDIRRRVRAGKRLDLARALGLHKNAQIRVLDTTCGLGRDSAVLAALGCEITATERHPALHALLADALRRERMKSMGWRGSWVALHHANAQDWLLQKADTLPPFDAIYIDPMFNSPRRKAQPQRALQWLQELLGADEDPVALLTLARQRARRVVVKNHARAAPLAAPDHQITGKAMRFDIYFNASKDVR